MLEDVKESYGFIYTHVDKAKSEACTCNDELNLYRIITFNFSYSQEFSSAKKSDIKPRVFISTDLP